jgi:divalent metal cation (Fe/Co/Zn/Cd) transporter
VVFFCHGSPRLLTVLLGVFLALRLGHGGFGAGDLWVVLGVGLYWPVQEWWVHIYLLHMRPWTWRGRTIEPPLVRIHGAHHREPWSIELALLPMSVLIAVGPTLVWLWWWAMPELGLALTGMTATTVATLAYEWVHYLTHTSYRPRSRLYRAIWRGHRLHHFKNERYWHAFTVPLVDTLLGTDPDPRTVETSPSCRDLERRGPGSRDGA